MAKSDSLEFSLKPKVATGGIIGMALLAIMLFAVAFWPQGDDTPSGLKQLREAENPACAFMEANPLLYPDGCPEAEPTTAPRDLQYWGVLIARIIVAWIGILCLGLISRMLVLARRKGPVLTLNEDGAHGAFLKSGLSWDEIETVSLVKPRVSIRTPATVGPVNVNFDKLERVEIIPKRSTIPLPVRILLIWPKGLAITGQMARGPFRKVPEFVEAHAPGKLKR